MVQFVKINPENNGGRSLPQANNNYDFALIKAVKNNDSIKFTNVGFGIEKISLKPGDNPVQHPDLLDEDKKSLIMIAVEKAINNPEYIEGILKTLIENEYQSNILDATNRTPLHVAAAVGNKVIVEKLLATKMLNIDKHHSDHGTALFAAIKNGHLEIAELLLTKGANINIQPFPVEDLIKSNDTNTLNYFIKLSTDNISAINNKTSIIQTSDFRKFSTNFKTQLFANNNLKLAAQNEQTHIFELLLRNFIIEGKTLAIRVATNDNQILIKVLNFFTTQEMPIEANRSELFESLLYNFISKNSITAIEVEKMLFNIHGLGKGKFIDIINRAIIKTIAIDEDFIDTTSLPDPDKAKILVNHIAKFGSKQNFNKLKCYELVINQLLEYSFLELAVKHNNFAMVDAIVQHILVYSDIKTVKNLLHIATSNMKKHVFNEKIMQEDNFQKFSKHFKQKLESGELLTTILQSSRENNLEGIKALVKLGTPVKAEHCELAEKDLKTFIYLSKNAPAGTLTSEFINTAKQKYINSIEPKFKELENIKTAGDFLDFTVKLAQYFDPNTTNMSETLEIQAQDEKTAFSLLGAESPY
ncbi:MAG TPA: ankyrin repeat domain-containing protein [Rickettsia endosymbiont of Pyrocoelia pectoralis]|nr:ankyrin repeat domain-containing protein [Rickettsia endosymbiont of Pyrocoelia pectoralis]